VVADVAKYQEFLPWCTHSRVLFRTPTRMDAELGKGPRDVRDRELVPLTTALRFSCARSVCVVVVVV
jgi:hypothetical protein